jgi:uncharacterized membrane protein (UPF0127 family)/CheY-like chemotaxis protein
MPKTKLVYNVTRGRPVCVGELADRPLRRMRGLLGRRGMPAGEGLLLTPAPAIHTAFMRFPIDALFLDGELRVLGIVERMPAWRTAARKDARAVLELAAGECERLGVAIGDRLELLEREAVDAPVPSAPTGPLHVLVLTSDRRFREVVSLLLTRRGVAVTVTSHAGGLAELAHAEAAGAVVIDTAHPGAASALEALAGLARRPGVVLADEDGCHAGGEDLVVAKWGAFEDLLTAIERANAVGGRQRDRDAAR